MAQARRRTSRPRDDAAPGRARVPRKRDEDAFALSRLAPAGGGDGAGGDASIVLRFDNALAPRLFGEFDQNLARLETALGVDARARGNEVSVSGEETAVASARRALDHLQALLAEGQEVGPADVDAAARMASMPPEGGEARADGAQMDLPTMAKMAMATIATRKKAIHARTPTQDRYMRQMGRAELTFGVGPAGTGKTYLAVAHAAMLLERGVVDRIVLTRPAVEAGERLGFLPGEMRDKMDPYLRPLYDALNDMIPADKVERALAAGVIEVAPLAFMRGRTLSNAVVILDEAQNTTSMQMKMFLTRLGENAAMIVTGDPTQIDLPPGQKSGLVEALRILDGVDGIAVTRFTGDDVVRHPLVGRIVKAYDADGAKHATGLGAGPGARAGGLAPVTLGGTTPLRRVTDRAVLDALPRVEVHDNLDDDDRASTDWGAEDFTGLNLIVRMGAAAVMAELPALAWPERVELGVLFGSDDAIADLNARFRGRPRPTNVLSFPAEEMAAGDAPPAYLGDLAFAHGTVLGEARERGVGLDRYLPILAVHGILHLIGHDHEASDAEADTMERLEARVLARLGLPDPYEGTEIA